MRDPRYDILFEPIKIGPVTAPNRFIRYRIAAAWAIATPTPTAICAV